MGDLRAFRVELDREFRSRFEQFDRRFEEAQHKFRNLSKVILDRHTHECRLSGELVDCPLEENKKQENFTMFEETDSADVGVVHDVVAPKMKESVRRRIARWEVRETNDYDAIVEHTECAFKKDAFCPQDLLKTFDYDLTVEQTDCVLDEKTSLIVGSAIGTRS